MPGGSEVKEAKDVKEVKDQSSRSAPVKNFSDLLVYKQAYKLALAISKLTKGFPREDSSNWAARYAVPRGLCRRT